ncbi:MAG: glucosamine-6-phosphate deaminase [Hadesarchaea archaeon]|nr:glucosamine-6-phosphate deaminase [Hadesarchaea archaeon]MDH5685319.1 glucosamine-6-phosphate deaminase [Hadesarchaea archaeon]
MEVSIKKGYDEISKRAAKIIADAIRNKPNLVLGLATGSTPIGCYRELVRMHKEEGLDFSRVVTFNLDEYIGLSPTHPQSYRYFMDQKLFNYVNIKRENTHVPNGLSDDFQKTCEEFEEAIKKSEGIDLQLLGIGTTGHIAFNEPGSPFDSRTRVVNVSEQTIKDNVRFFKSIDEVPRQVISMGTGTIMEAREIILLASGAGKADAVAKSVNGPVTEEVPASILQTHPNCTFIIDEAAASKLESI